MLLVALDFAEGDGAGSESVLFSFGFHSTCSWGGLLLGHLILASFGASVDASLLDFLFTGDLLSGHLNLFYLNLNY